MKKILLLLQFPILIFSQEKIKILDSETSQPIPGARLISNQNVYYSNEDGFVNLPENAKDINISAFGYLSENLKTPSENVSLKPKYQNIEEVKIVNVDIKKILKEVLENYSKIYYDKPIIYDVTVKQRAFENNNMKLLMVADGKFWSRDGQYNAKEAHNDKFDKFVQLQIDDLRYLKNEKYDSPLKLKKQSTSQDNIGDMFFSYELFRTLTLSNIKRAKTSGRLLYEDDDEQEISFSIKTESNLLYKGFILYNKTDKAITHFELVFTQSGAKPYQLKDENKQEYYRQLGDGIITFDFYKVGNKYYPSKNSFIVEGFKNIMDDATYEYRSAREIIFKNFEETTKTLLENHVDINNAFWSNLKISQDKGEILLSKEESEFINEESLKKDNPE